MPKKKIFFRFDVDEQKIVGAIKSLEALGEDVIKTEIQQVSLQNNFHIFEIIFSLP